MSRIAALACAALAAAPLLSGCVAMAALPVLAGGAMVAGGNAKIRAATPRPKSDAPASRLARERTAGMAVAAGTGVVLTGLTALPPPDAVQAAADPWRRFLAYARERAARVAAGEERRSALLAPGISLAVPRMRDCTAKVPAVVIDLDPGARAFDAAGAAAAAPPPPALADGLAELRAAGVVVAWISGAPAAAVADVAEALRVSGLDPAGADPLLLVRTGKDRKQLLREEAGADVCVIAIAGDGKADFDELFDYLRDPASATGLDSLLGVGWFLTPPPLG